MSTAASSADSIYAQKARVRVGVRMRMWRPGSRSQRITPIDANQETGGRGQESGVGATSPNPLPPAERELIADENKSRVDEILIESVPHTTFRAASRRHRTSDWHLASNRSMSSCRDLDSWRCVLTIKMFSIRETAETEEECVVRSVAATFLKEGVSGIAERQRRAEATKRSHVESLKR